MDGYSPNPLFCVGKARKNTILSKKTKKNKIIFGG